MNRNDLRQLAAARETEARALLGGGHAGGAYYLAGYAVECALKAAIAKQTSQFDFPDKDRANRAHTHSLTELVRLAGLEKSLGGEMQADRQFDVFWTVVKDWNEASRYRQATIQEATSLVEAVTNPQHGVLRWLRQFW